jgi:arylformamidase
LRGKSPISVWWKGQAVSWFLKDCACFDMITLNTTFIVLLTAGSLGAAAVESNGTAQATLVPATFPNVSYGPHPRNVLDFWQAKSDHPTPVLFFIHGGGWRAGDKSTLPPRTLEFMLAHQISVAAINYRYSRQARLPAPVHDAARALQFLRSKATEWNIDKTRIAAMGPSAGGCTSLWLAYREDLAAKNSPDPVARESTQVCAAAGIAAQTSIDPKVVIPWVGDQIMDHEMMYLSVGATNKTGALGHYEEYRDLYHEFSPINHVSRNGAPVFLYYGTPTPLPAPNPGIAIHHAIMGQKLKEKADALGLVCELHYSQPANADDPIVSEFLLRYLTRAR